MAVNMQSSLPVAIVGAGNIARSHAAGYQAAGASVLAVCDVDRERAQSFAGELDAQPYGDVEEMLESVRPAAVSICTPPAAHLEPALAGIRRGIPLLCEKPLANALAAARSIEAAARTSGVSCMVGFCHRFHEPVLQIREILQAGEIGEPVLFRNRFAYRFEGVERSWFSNSQISGGGTLMDTSVHSLDLYRFLIGEITQVAAQLTTLTPELTVEDNSVLLVNGPRGVPGIIEASWTTPVGESVLSVFGSDGCVMVDYEAGDFGVARVRRAGVGSWTELPRTDHDRFGAEIAHFIASVRAGHKPSPDAQDGVRALEVVDAAYQVGWSGGYREIPETARSLR